MGVGVSISGAQLLQTEGCRLQHNRGLFSAPCPSSPDRFALLPLNPLHYPKYYFFLLNPPFCTKPV
jgi:hypothetical protein